MRPLAFTAFLLSPVVLTVLGLAIAWWIGGAPTGRPGAVAELTLAVTFLGFSVAVVAILISAHSSGLASRPYSLSFGDWAQDQELSIPLSGAAGIPTAGFGVGPSLRLENAGAAPARIERIGASATVVTVRDGGWGTVNSGFRVAPLEMGMLVFGSLDLRWVPDVEGWSLNTGFVLSPRTDIRLPVFMLYVDDPVPVAEMLRVSDCRLRLNLAIHTDRGVSLLQMEIPIRANGPAAGVAQAPAPSERA